jgi:tetratricopeptide (TPR) repeat protein
VARAAARAFDTPDGGRWLERLDREHRDLLAAIEWSRESGNAPRTLALLRALGQYWVRRSRLDAVLPWYEQVAASDPAPGTEEDLAAVLRQHSFALVLKGDLEGPRPLLQRALQLARSVASRQEEARVANALGVLAVFRQELDAGTEWYQRASALAAEAGVDDLVPFVLNNLGDVHLFRGRLEQAAACYREAVSRLRALGNLQMLSNVLGSLGLVTVREGDLPSAEAALRESLTIVRDLGITISVHPALEQYAALATAAGDASVAGRLWGAADALRNRLGLEPEWFAAEERARWQAEATRLVGAEALGAFVTSGAELSLDAAVELALVEGRRLARGAVRGARRGAARSSPAPAAPGE